MPILYGGITLPLPTDEADAWILNSISYRDVIEFEDLTWPGPRILHWAFRGYIPLRPIKLGSLFWPATACKWATAHFLINKTKADQIRALAYSPTTTGYKALPFVLDDGNVNGLPNHSITTDMYVLPPRPLAQITGEEQLYLLTLVDERFLWWQRAAKITISYTGDGPTDWLLFYQDIASALGFAVNITTPSPKYLSPSKSLESDYEYLPILLDAVAYNMGKKIIRKLAGGVFAQSPTEAKASEDAQIDSFAKHAGGKFQLLVTDNPNDLQALVPKQVTVVYPRINNGISVPSNSYKITKTLISLALPEYGSYEGHEGVKFFHDEPGAFFTSSLSVPSNFTQLDQLTEQIAKDWYRWQLGRSDIAYAGIVNYDPHGYADIIEWQFNSHMVQTRVQRGPWNDLNNTLNHKGDHSVINSPDDCCDIESCCDINISEIIAATYSNCVLVPVPTTITGCASCPGNVAAQYFTFDLSNATLVSKTNCQSCESLEKKFVLTWQSSCTWKSDPVDFCSTSPRWRFVKGSGNTWNLYFRSNGSAGGGVAYSADLPSWNCKTPVTLKVIHDGRLCDGWPDTITLSPSDASGNISSCTDTSSGSCVGTVCLAFDDPYWTGTIGGQDISLICDGPGGTGWVLITGGVSYFPDPFLSNCDDGIVFWIPSLGTCSNVKVVITFDPADCNTGSVGGGNGGTIQTACCAGPIPRTLFGTFSNVSGCACLAGKVVTLIFAGTAGTSTIYAGTASSSGCPGTGTIDVHLTCLGNGLWSLTIVCNGTNSNAMSSSASCLPTDVQFTSVQMNGGCCASGTFPSTPGFYNFHVTE